VRRNGVLTPLPLGELARDIDFGDGPVSVVSIPWGDVSTAYRSTAIGNIEVYVAANSALRLGMRLSNLFAPLLRASWMQAFLKRRAQQSPPGPTARERAQRSVRIWGEASDSQQRVVSRLRTPEAYTLTIETALAATEAALRGPVQAGFQTPSRAFGPDFVLQVPGVIRRDE